MMAVRMFDSSTPLRTAPSGYRAVAGYIGGDTPHVWTEVEWLRFQHVRKLPIFVRSNPQDVNPVDDAFAALRELYYLNVPKRCAVAWDMETAVHVPYLRAVHRIMRWAGYHVWVYGSASTVFGNPPLDGYWVADYAGVGPFMYGHANVRATQYEPGGAYDSSLLKWWSWKFRLWL